MSNALPDILEAAREQNLSPLDVISRIADAEKASRLEGTVEPR
jgi:hypothetical protein